MQEAPAIHCTESVMWARSLSLDTKISASQRLIWEEKKVTCVVETTCRTSSVDLLQFDCLDSCAYVHNATLNYITINMCSTQLKCTTIVPGVVAPHKSWLEGNERWQKWLRTMRVPSTWSQGHWELYTARNSTSLAVEISATEQWWAAIHWCGQHVVTMQSESSIIF